MNAILRWSAHGFTPWKPGESVCFSATASFVTAAVLAVAGAVTLSRVNEPRELPLAATPMLFALQQGIEGMLWLTLPTAPDGAISTGLTYLFLFFAGVLWPVYAPVAVLLIEPDQRRRHFMFACLAIGICVAANLFWWILTRGHGAAILGGHIVYGADDRRVDVVGLAYLAVTGLPLLLSSRRTVVALGAIVLSGSAIAYAFYWEAFVSVWCFFAAAASGVILYHFESSHRYRLWVAGTAARSAARL